MRREEVGTKKHLKTKKLALGSYKLNVPAGANKRISFALAPKLTKLIKSYVKKPVPILSLLPTYFWPGCP